MAVKREDAADDSLDVNDCAIRIFALQMQLRLGHLPLPGALGWLETCNRFSPAELREAGKRIGNLPGRKQETFSE
jgi:hypothetical protein